MYGFTQMTEEQVTQRAQLMCPMCAQLGHPVNEELMPLWGAVVATGLNTAPSATGETAGSEGEAASAGDSGASAETGAVADPATTGGESSTSDATTGGESSTGDASTDASGAAAVNPIFFNPEAMEEHQEMMEEMAESGFFPGANFGANGASTGAAGAMPNPMLFGGIEEAGDSESAFAGAAAGCFGMEQEEAYLCMSKTDETACSACAIAGCVWAGQMCVGMGMLNKPHRHKHHLRKAHTTKSQNVEPVNTVNPMVYGIFGLSFGVLLGCGIGAAYSHFYDRNNPLEEKMIA